MAQFIGTPLTLWEGDRNMKLMEDFSFIDNAGKNWTAPKGCFLNGATIPQALWSTIGSPYTGPYRRASIVHDYFVGEDRNPDPISYNERRKADKMFYEACIHGGCSKRFAGILYMGVTIGSWASQSPNVFGQSKLKAFGNIKLLPEENLIKSKFDLIVNSMDSDLDTIEFDELEKRVNKFLPIN